jgi:hypothetical protein
MMNVRLKGVAEYITREAIDGFYNKPGVCHGDNQMAVMRAYNVLLCCIHSHDSDTEMAKEVTKAVLSAYWGKPLSGIDLHGDRYKRACLDVFRAIQDSIKKTRAD